MDNSSFQRKPSKSEDKNERKTGFFSPSIKRRKSIVGDRFIPNRDLTSEFSAAYNAPEEFLSPTKRKKTQEASADETFKTLLRSELFGNDEEESVTGNTNRSETPVPQTPPSSSSSGPAQNNAGPWTTPVTPSRKVFRYMSPRDRSEHSTMRSMSPFHDDPRRNIYSLSPVKATSHTLLTNRQARKRDVPQVPYKVLDAPGLRDDFYINVLDWGNCNILAVALGSRVYLWSALTREVTLLTDFGPAETVTSLSWVQRGTHLAVGKDTGVVELWDAETCRQSRTMTGHSSRVGVLSWNEHVLSTGGRDTNIFHRDVRAQEHYFRKLEGHQQEVCGLQWSPFGDQLASGGNDNALLVWERYEERPVYQFNRHRAAVRGIAWSPHQRGLLASGGGTADRTMKMWNARTGAFLRSTDTGSQVCNLAWSRLTNEVVSTHGFMENEIALWDSQNLTKVGVLHGHTSRVQYLTMSPNGESIVTGSGDETLRFWKLFDAKAQPGTTIDQHSFDSLFQIR
ncbi:CDK inhibitor Srw1 [Schizosaccharomyces japonicus yFS275]|uniref:CDK inhibitor Srw1 n=1 Tax=Schizosaccharomyces japonicus (strain yFS275 / FY16936) TaxID=402676 RepID=B6JUX2_SCHJY|nr:CDK inhibitor Srw1 [Schizosaccharomyces japonicus yFS275]EEB05076.1 CDK inhibitor Srw1 [Schizosaccharomyces japonicus yFS275]